MLILFDGQAHFRGLKVRRKYSKKKKKKKKPDTEQNSVGYAEMKVLFAAVMPCSRIATCSDEIMS
jgi:hypothetical protein